MEDSLYYKSLGVSSAKTEVIKASKSQGEGLFPNAFCKIVPDFLANSPNHCMALHSDGAGTKAVVAYLMYKETRDFNYFASLAQDALVMNIDDLLCIGACGPFLVSNVIGRNSKLIPAGAIESIISGYESCCSTLANEGIEIHLCGGETADMGDAIRTLVVDASVACRLRKESVIDGLHISKDDVIVGLSSTGMTRYEQEENSGIGSNGLTFARHSLLNHGYYDSYPEVVAPEIPEKLAYHGKHALFETHKSVNMSIGKALLSPTRTYAPFLIRALCTLDPVINGIVHCTGGGQTKCMNLTRSVSVIKDNLFEPPPIFKLIKNASGASWKQMYQVFNMGHRMELFVKKEAAKDIIDLAKEFQIDARVIGHCRSVSNKPRLKILSPSGWLTFQD